ncbi:MAG: hypothetical protein OXU77_03665 [Gammaproteobacteria bacterium]|nr:hypothetical protein [Gammaproteobacteria bacterium]MDE0444731.1 hypothetical protein [Gammaproteobacteria bacterium]
MSSVERCLRDIDKVRSVASGHEEAYVARSRLARLILRATNVADEVAGMATAGSACTGVSMTGREEMQVKVSQTCARLDACRKAASHASEPLDDRWRQMWDEIGSHLDTLEALLRESRPDLLR